MCGVEKLLEGILVVLTSHGSITRTREGRKVSEKTPKRIIIIIIIIKRKIRKNNI